VTSVTYRQINLTLTFTLEYLREKKFDLSTRLETIIYLQAIYFNVRINSRSLSSVSMI